ncbi:MAG: type II secretion system protein [Bacillota bacterium]
MKTMLAIIRRMLQRSKDEKGFTLIELMVVVAILGILAAVAIPKFSSSTTTAKKSKVKADLGTIESAISMYKSENNDLAPAAIVNLVSGTPSYLKAEPKDPWNDRSYAYDRTNGTPYYKSTVAAGGEVGDVYAWSTDW